MSDAAADTHLLVVAGQFDEIPGGVQTHLKHLLPRLVTRGIRTTIAYLGTPGPARDFHGVTVLPLRRRLDFRHILAWPDPFEWRRFAGSLGVGQPLAPTHIATHTRFFPMTWYGTSLGRRLGVPVVHTEHGAGSVVTSPPYVAAASTIVDRTLGRRSLRSAARVLSVSEATRRFVRDLADVDSTVIGNGIDLADWLPQQLSTETGSPRDLVFVGRLVAEKGWGDFLRAAQACAQAGWKGRTRFLGTGPDAADIRGRASAAGLEVDLVGEAGPGTVRDALRGAVYVNPSRAAEGFQLTQLEALAAGASLVGYAVGVADELAAVPGVDATIVPLGDAKALAKAAVAAVTRPAPHPTWEQLSAWDWDTVADRYVDVLREVARE